MKQITLILALVLTLGACTKQPQPQYVQAKVQGINITYNNAYGYENKIYAVGDNSTVIVDIQAKRLYYLYSTQTYTDTITNLQVELRKGYYSGIAETASHDYVSMFNVLNKK